MATAKQPDAIKCVAYENSSPWYILWFKTLQKSPLCICNDMLIYTVQVWKKVSFKKIEGLLQLEIFKILKPYKFIMCLGWLATLQPSILGCGGCHDNTVVKVLQEMYYYVLLNCIYGNSKTTRGAVKCVAYKTVHQGVYWNFKNCKNSLCVFVMTC